MSYTAELLGKISCLFWKSYITLFPKKALKNLFILSLAEMSQEEGMAEVPYPFLITNICTSIYNYLDEYGCLNIRTKTILENIVEEFLQDEF